MHGTCRATKVTIISTCVLIILLGGFLAARRDPADWRGRTDRDHGPRRTRTRRASAAQPKLELEHLWLYVSINMLPDENVAKLQPVLERAAKAGYTGIVLTDSKFFSWDKLGPKYQQNVAKVRDACGKLRLACIAAVAPIGYSNNLLSRDPNLAEGLPVVNAEFVVKGGKLLPAENIKLVNGGFEQGADRKGTPAGWSFVDQPGKISFLDAQVAREGRTSLRMQDMAKHNPQTGHGRVHQAVKVQPFHNYHFSAYVKTENFDVPDELKLLVTDESGAALAFPEMRVGRTQDWQRLDVVFDSLEAKSVNLYLGAWGGKGGKIWWDDARLEPAGLVNVVRRPGAPFKLASADGQTVYEEDKDFAEAADPKLAEFAVWHEMPLMTVPKGSRLVEGQQVRASYYFAPIVHGGQVACCLSEPKVYELLAWQAANVRRAVAPDGYFMSHDEIRVAGWDDACAQRKLTCGEMLADNVKRCAELIAQEDKGKPIYVWSDMFDPTHNALKAGRYYLVPGDGPWYGSWKGLPKDVTVVNWNFEPGTRVESLKHFAGLGNRQILAGYYDAQPRRIGEWLRDAAAVPGVIGVMYTTWQNKYDDLETFAEEVKKFKK